ncbi:helix-turn-helix transcriptional regulator, partial [Kitasatospora nipponensis]|uniref:helix-turn-helix domain-containing protein n=1 Tax=Kitasatospora nipponensis TaxID=258049 RepID=UPI0031D848C3
MHAQRQQPAPTASEFGRQLMARGRAAGLTQSELAARSGVSVRAISELETGRSRAPQRRSAQALAAALALLPADREVLLRAAVAGRSRPRRTDPARTAPTPPEPPHAPPTRTPLLRSPLAGAA